MYLPQTVDQNLKSLDVLLKGMKQVIDEREIFLNKIVVITIFGMTICFGTGILAGYCYGRLKEKE